MRERGELPAGPAYIVQPGDTLYAIAFRLGMDYRTLAAINQIDAPYVIRAGQSLATEAPNVVMQSESRSADANAADSESVAKSQGQSNSQGPAPAHRTQDAAPAPSASADSVAPLSTKAKPSSSQSASPVSGVVVQPTPQPAIKPKSAPLPNAPVDRWGWPAKGRITRSYSEDVHKGIDLAGARGDPVRASAAGVVVYAGTGVTGYGALIIVKHNDTYLSAYGHNDQLLAAEGEQVSAGKLIARMGSSGTDSVKLHFEIRHNGRPVNPATLLTSR
jgi:lipoprotein NlpD